MERLLVSLKIFRKEQLIICPAVAFPLFVCFAGILCVYALTKFLQILNQKFIFQADIFQIEVANAVF